jgi:imidazolonepropionase
MLEAILTLDREEAIDLVPTFLGAHAVPFELIKLPIEQASDLYIDLVCQEMLPAVKGWWLEHDGESALPFVDVFCDQGAFSLKQSRKVLQEARQHGFPLKIHSDEFEALGGTSLAIDLGACSADHLVATKKSEIKALGKSDTVAVSLPATTFGLGGSRYTPAKTILKEDGILALATDLNPGTAWCESMQMTIAMACRYLGLSPAQAIAASTINAAAAVNRSDSVGSLESGKQADLIVLDAADYRHLGYRFGTNLVHTVIKSGRVVWDRLMEV